MRILLFYSPNPLGQGRILIYWNWTIHLTGATSEGAITEEDGKKSDGNY